ncbi:MAG: LysR family transcriptional regulator [Pseudolabrys sp.]|jgi:DNA-binding transcriptional LysR family regulator
MELAWLEDYLALAETLNFSKAAAARHVTQPAFSRRIRALEDWVGAMLFERTTHNVALTLAGNAFHDQAEELARALHQLRRNTLEAASRGVRPLGIAATHALSFTFFPKWVRSNDRILALGNLNLVSDSMEACEQMMLRGDVQFLLCHYHRAMNSKLAAAKFTSIVVGTDTLVAVSAPGKDGRARWRLDGKKPVKYLGYSAQSGLGRIVATQWRPEDSESLVEVVFTSHLAATLMPMARAGDGVAWLPRTLAEEDLIAKRLVSASAGGSAIRVDVRLFRPVARQDRIAEAVWAAFKSS